MKTQLITILDKNAFLQHWYENVILKGSTNHIWTNCTLEETITFLTDKGEEVTIIVARQTKPE